MTVRVNQQIMVDSEMIEFICNENQQFLKPKRILELSVDPIGGPPPHPLRALRPASTVAINAHRTFRSVDGGDKRHARRLQ